MCVCLTQGGEYQCSSVKSNCLLVMTFIFLVNMIYYLDIHFFACLISLSSVFLSICHYI